MKALYIEKNIWIHKSTVSTFNFINPHGYQGFVTLIVNALTPFVNFFRDATAPQ
jgi:hypothetical protein